MSNFLVSVVLLVIYIQVMTELSAGSCIYALGLPEAMRLQTGDLTVRCVFSDKHERQQTGLSKQ